MRVRATVFEAGDRVGGKMNTIRDGGYLVEEGPNGWLDNERATRRLLAALGLENEVIRSEDAARRRFVLADGKPCEVPLSPAAFLKSRVLPLRAKLRAAAEPFVPASRSGRLAAQDPRLDETIYEFGARRLGREFAERLLDPMVKGIFGGDARRLSLAACFPRMVELETEYGGLVRAMVRIARERKRSGRRGPSAAGPSGALLSLRGGMGCLTQALARKLRGRVLTRAPVVDVVQEGADWWVLTEGARHGPFECVVDASPAHSAARHLARFGLSELLCGIPYVPIAVVTLAFEVSRVGNAIEAFGMLNPTREGKRLLGVLWSSAIFRGRAPEGTVLFRCMVGGAHDPSAVNLDDDELVRLCTAELDPIHRFAGAPARHWVIRHEKAIAQYERGHLCRLKALEERTASVPGLWLAGSSYRGVSANHCIAEAERVARDVLDYIASRSRRSQAQAAIEREAAGV